ncbi:MAG: YezD family protein [Verrucomicrobiota bacterium]|nr:YezD family protein [Verrucomicrobiota bacterium]
MDGGQQDSGVCLSETEKQILNAIRGIRFGSVEIVVQDGKVVQIERKEKVRLKNS